MINLKTLQKTKPGTRLTITRAQLKFWDTAAFSICCIGGVIKPDEEEAYAARKALGMGAPYKCTFIKYVDVEPGAKVEITMANKIKFKTILGYRDINFLKGGSRDKK